MACDQLVDLTAEEERELGELENLGGTRTADQSARYWHLMERRCARPSPKWEQSFHEKFPEISAAFAAENRPDHDEARRLLQALAPPPQSMVAVLERRINDALRSMRKTAVLVQAPAAHVASRPRERKPKHTARGSRGDPDREPDPPLARPRGVSPRQLVRRGEQRNGGNKHVHLSESAMREWLVLLEEDGRVRRVSEDRWVPLHLEGGWWRAVASIVDYLVGEREAAA